MTTPQVAAETTPVEQGEKSADKLSLVLLALEDAVHALETLGHGVAAAHVSRGLDLVRDRTN